MMAAGAVMGVPQLQARVAVAAGPIGAWTDRSFGDLSRSGLSSQFGVGVLSGACGVHAWDQPWEPPPSLRPEVKTLCRWR